MKGLKAQLWSTDLTISIFVFISVVAAFLFAWGYIATEAQSVSRMSEMESMALSVSDALIRIPGYPPDWNETNVMVLGLADGENILNQTKVDRFVAMDYQKAKNILGTDWYHFHFTVSDTNRTLLATKGPYPSNATSVVPVERYVLYGSTPAIMNMLFWI